jgi:hypothetical protein
MSENGDAPLRSATVTGLATATATASEEAQHQGYPLYVQLARRLLQAGAAGATALRVVSGATTGTTPRTATGCCRCDAGYRCSPWWSTPRADPPVVRDRGRADR